MRRLAAPSLTVLALAFGLWAGTPDAATAQGRQATDNLPVLLTSDEMTSDEELGVVTASGNVEIAHGGRILRADTLTYNRRTGVVTASGNVSVVEASGEVAFAEYVELTSDLRDGVMRNIRTMLADQSRFAAVTARRADGSRTVMRRATYSPCEPCEKDPTRAPIWQLRASRITHDSEQKEIVYDDAWMEIAGVPVFYTPYLSHPDGTEKRKSGFLPPDVATSSRNGSMLATPYYWTLGPSADLTVTPIFMSNDNPLMAAEYRERMRNGVMSFEGAVLRTKESGESIPDWRGFARLSASQDINDNWRTGLDASRATDKTFIERYRLRRRFALLEQNTLESRAFVERFSDETYLVANLFAFQGLRPEDTLERVPYALPYGNFRWTDEPGVAGGRYGLDADIMSIYRETGQHVQRVSVTPTWRLPHTTRTGEIYTLSTSLRIDGFHTADPEIGRDQFQASSSGSATRLLPQIALSWQLPLVRKFGVVSSLIEPMTAIYLAPNLGSQRELPNEDSRGLTFDDTNLFRLNRFTGSDRLETGARFVYGFNTRLNAPGQLYSAFVGHQLRMEDEQAVPSFSGLQKRSSDFVTRVSIQPHPMVEASHRAQFRSESGEMVRSLSTLTLGPSALRLSMSHIRIDRSLQPTANDSINQVGTSVIARLSEYWRTRASIARDLGNQSGTLLATTALIYEDDCFLWGLEGQRRNIGRADIPPDTALFFRFGFRNLGELALRGF
jgi:LPS-assembly protein